MGGIGKRLEPIPDTNTEHDRVQIHINGVDSAAGVQCGRGLHLDVLHINIGRPFLIKRNINPRLQGNTEAAIASSTLTVSVSRTTTVPGCSTGTRARIPTPLSLYPRV